MTALSNSCADYLKDEEIKELYQEMYKVNLEIWEGMDQLYEIDPSNSEAFIELTNSITELNKQRAYVKRKIDTLAKSQFSEEKSYF